MTRAEQMPMTVADIAQDPYFLQLLATSIMSRDHAVKIILCVNAWHERQNDPGQRLAPGLGLKDDQLMLLAKASGLVAPRTQTIDFARSVLSAATRRRGQPLVQARDAAVATT